MGTDIPQIVAIAKAGKNGAVPLKREVRQYLGSKDAPVFLSAGEEILLTAGKAGANPAEMQRNRLCPPAALVERLQLQTGCHVAAIERGKAVALKKLVIEEMEGDGPRITDIETPLLVRRVAATNPAPEDLMSRLRDEQAGAKLTHDVRRFLRGRRSLPAWSARRLLAMPDDTDDALGEELVAERLAGQDGDGSWAGKVPLTARMLRELGELGVSPRRKAMRKGIDWLLDRADPVASPGMFLLSDELTKRQAKCLAEGGRFRDLKPAERALAAEGHPLFRNPCGPRILWPNAVVLDALLSLGCERRERVQNALKSTILSGWCECAAQNGVRLWRMGPRPSSAQVDKTVMEAVAGSEWMEGQHYRYGGIGGAARLVETDTTSAGVLSRVSRRSEGAVEVFELKLPDWGGVDCGLVSAWGLRRARNGQARRSGEAEMCNVVGRQRSGGTIGPGPDSFTYSGHAVFLETAAAYDCAVAKVAVLRYVPGIIASQNPDGSWGEGEHKDDVTLVVLRTLVSGRDYLPTAMLP